MTPHDSEPAAPSSDRAAKGQFARGNKGGPGNPFARQVAELRKVFLDAITPDDMRALMRALIERAKNGDVAAAKLVFQYTLGKPAPAVEPDRLELDEHRLRAESAVPRQVWEPMLLNLQAHRVNELADILEPVLERRILDPLEKAVRGEEPTRLSRSARKAMRREMRRLRLKSSPSTNGSNGRDLDERLHGPKQAAQRLRRPLLGRLKPLGNDPSPDGIRDRRTRGDQRPRCVPSPAAEAQARRLNVDEHRKLVRDRTIFRPCLRFGLGTRNVNRWADNSDDPNVAGLGEFDSCANVSHLFVKSRIRPLSRNDSRSPFGTDSVARVARSPAEPTSPAPNGFAGHSRTRRVRSWSLPNSGLASGSSGIFAAAIFSIVADSIKSSASSFRRTHEPNRRPLAEYLIGTSASSPSSRPNACCKARRRASCSARSR